MTRYNPPMPETRTVRQQMIEALREGPHTARTLSQRLRISEKDVAPHLEHVARSLHPPPRLVVTPAFCHRCGYRFRERRRFTTPSRCPECRHEGIEPPVFQIDPQAG